MSFRALAPLNRYSYSNVFYGPETICRCFHHVIVDSGLLSKDAFVTRERKCQSTDCTYFSFIVKELVYCRLGNLRVGADSGSSEPLPTFGN